MWNKLRIDPVAKQRPVVARFGTFTPKKTKENEAALKLLLKRYKKMPDVALELSLIFIVKKPKKPKYDFPSRSDLDNFVKQFCDAANGILWSDDRFVAKFDVEKKWGDEGEIWFKLREKAKWQKPMK